MDFTFLYIIGVVVATVCLYFIAIKYPIKKEYRDILILTLELSEEFVDSLDLKNEDKIKEIYIIIKKTLQYLSSMSDVSGSSSDIVIDYYEIATSYAYSLCDDMNIKLTDSRKNIIDSLLKYIID